MTRTTKRAFGMMVALLAWGQAAMAQEAPLHASRQSTLMNAKNLTLTTTSGVTFYYLVSADAMPVIRLGETLRIGADDIPIARVRSLRFRSLSRAILDEDSTTFDTSRTLDHSLLALRRTLGVGTWNSIVLPFDLTGRQVLEAFGDETQLAGVRGIGDDEETVVEFQSVDLATDDVALTANRHYLIRPSREADVLAGRSLYNFIGNVPGPIYLIPNVTMKAAQSARLQTLTDGEGNARARLRGTYLKLDDSVLQGRIVRNRRVAPGTYTLSDEGQMVLHTDSAEVGAFRSWIEDLGNTGKPLRFYIDGVGETIDVVADAIPELADSPIRGRHPEAVYDLSGRRMAPGKLPRGIYVSRGKKFTVK